MADVTGPISTLPGSSHDVPNGTKCDDHPDRPAVVRVQGETDSFGSEMHDLCQECADRDRAECNSVEARTGRCDWCKQDAIDLRPRRDWEEGPCGPVYEVCGTCVKKENERLAQELADDYDDHFDDDEDDYDVGEDCGRWANGQLRTQCSKAGSEECDWECPIGLPGRGR